MKFGKKDFDKCLFNPLEELFWFSSKKLQEIGTEVMVKYVIMMYDPYSPLRREYQDIEERSRVAQDISGYKEYTAPVIESDDEDDNEDVIEEDDSNDITRTIIGYLRLVKSMEWAMIVSIEAAVWELSQRLLQPIKFVGAGQDKDKLAAVNMKSNTVSSMVDMHEKLKSLKLKFYEGDIELQEKAEEVQDIKYNPQGIAKAMNKNK